MSHVLKVGQIWRDEEGGTDEILSIDEGTDYPVQFKMRSSAPFVMPSIGRDTIEGFLSSHTQPTSWWLTMVMPMSELQQSLKNIGYDITCGQCASVFHTGGGNYPHDEGCATK